MTLLRNVLILFRIRIAFFAACSAAAGYFAAATGHPAGAIAPAFGVFLLACGASGLNQVQERDIDANMDRTKHRPLPTGKLRPGGAAFVSLACIAAGSSVCYVGGGSFGVFAGLGALLVYNGIYTPLKRLTAFAAIPGALVGMLPPLIGWAAAGRMPDYRVAPLCLIMFLWQVPHFWLLLLHRGEEYRRAGLPSLACRLSRAQLGRVVFTWIVAAAIAGFSLPFYGLMKTPPLWYVLIPAAAWLVWSSRSLIGPALADQTPVLFTKINIHLLLFLSLISWDGVFSRS